MDPPDYLVNIGQELRGAERLSGCAALEAGGAAGDVHTMVYTTASGVFLPGIYLYNTLEGDNTTPYT